MIRIRLLSVCIGALVLASPVQGQVRLGAGAGLAIPTGDLGRIDEIGYQASVSLQSTPQLARFGFRADAMFAAFDRKATIQDITERIAFITLGPMIRRPGLATSFPYLIGGIGIYNQSMSPQPIGGTTSTDLGFNAGAGVRFKLAGRRVFAEARYHQVTAAGARFVPLTFGTLF